MTNAFMTSTKQALLDLRVAQAKHSRLKVRADRRLEVARVRHASETAEAAFIEVEAWQLLLSIPGVSVATAAAMLQVSETSISRWAARIRKAAPGVQSVDKNSYGGGV